MWRGRQRWRLPAFVLSLLPIALMLWPSGPFRAAYQGGAWEYMANSAANPVTSFVRSFGRMALERPTYDLADAAHIDWGRAAAPASGNAQLPDIVIVLEESTLDPREWAACDIPECTVHMFQPDARTAAHGDLQVHTYGGGTWTSEFTLFAGIPSTLFGDAGIYAPYNLAPRMRDSLPQLLRSRGYRTVAVYPMPRDFVNADVAYAHYGFDEFIDGPQIEQRWESTDPEEVQKFSEIYRRERAATTQPLFFMLLTLRQHGPHNDPLDTLPAPYNQPLFPKLDAATNRSLGNYLSRLHQSDAAIDELEKLVLDGPQPAVLAHFGDHHPSFDGLEQKLDLNTSNALKPVASALTYYVIKTNAPNPPQHRYEVLDLAFLGGLVLDVAGVPKDAYFEANSKLRERCMGRFVECADEKVLASYYAEIFGRLKIVDR